MVGLRFGLWFELELWLGLTQAMLIYATAIFQNKKKKIAGCDSHVFLRVIADGLIELLMFCFCGVKTHQEMGSAATVFTRGKINEFFLMKSHNFI